MDAWEVLKERKDIELHIVGDGTLKETVIERAKGNIKFHGKLDLNELSNMYRSCDVLIHPSMCDTLTLIVLEAASSGLYILESDWLKGTYDDLEEKGYLKYIESTSSGITENIILCAKKAKEIRKAKEDISRYIKENYDWKAISDKFFGTLKQIVESNC